MKKVCISCKSAMPRHGEKSANGSFITNGICSSCIRKLSDPEGDSRSAFLDSLGSPVLLMQAQPRKVVTANKSACALFRKDLKRIEGHRGGEVFNCEYAFTEAGCGVDEHCRDCIIRNTIVETFKTGTPREKVSANLNIRSVDQIKPHWITISTEKVGESALVRIDQFQERKSGTDTY